MTFYRNRVYPHIVTLLGNPEPVRKIRQQLIPQANGVVLEIGVGPRREFSYRRQASTPSSARSPFAPYRE